MYASNCFKEKLSEKAKFPEIKKKFNNFNITSFHWQGCYLSLFLS